MSSVDGTPEPSPTPSPAPELSPAPAPEPAPVQDVNVQLHALLQMMQTMMTKLNSQEAEIASLKASQRQPVSQPALTSQPLQPSLVSAEGSQPRVSKAEEGPEPQVSKAVEKPIPQVSEAKDDSKEENQCQPEESPTADGPQHHSAQQVDTAAAAPRQDPIAGENNLAQQQGVVPERNNTSQSLHQQDTLYSDDYDDPMHSYPDQTLQYEQFRRSAEHRRSRPAEYQESPPDTTEKMLRTLKQPHTPRRPRRDATALSQPHIPPLSRRHATALSVRAHWWWPKMIDDIRAHVSSCEVCRHTKASGNPLQQGTLSTYQPLFPGQCLAIDIYDPSDTGGEEEQSAKLALVAVYSFTRNTCVVPLMSKSATEVANALTTIFADFGVPSMVRHDRGREFDGAVSTLCETLGIEQVRSASHSAQSNGAVERVNQELKKELRRLRQQRPDKQWESFLPTILIKLRTTVNSSTKFSPYELMGISSPAPRGASWRATPEQFMDFRDFNDNDLALVKAMTASMQQRQHRALVNDIEARDNRLTDQNKSRKPMEFSKGQWIRVQRPSSNKMEPQVSEPKLIIDVSDNKAMYTVQDPTTARTSEVHIGNMIPSQGPSSSETTKRQQRKGQQAAIARKTTSAGTKYFVVDNSEKARASSIRRLFINSRPGSQESQAKWTLNKTQTVKDCEILTEFTFDISNKGHLVIPKFVRQQHKEVSQIHRRAREH